MRGAGAIFSGLGWLPSLANYFRPLKMILKDVESFHVKNVWFASNQAAKERRE